MSALEIADRERVMAEMRGVRRDWYSARQIAAVVDRPWSSIRHRVNELHATGDLECKPGRGAQKLYRVAE